MTNKKRDASPKPTDKGKVKFQGFLSVKLKPEEKKYIADHPLAPDDYGQLAADLAFKGYKVSLSFSEGQDSYILTAYGNRLGNVDEGWAVSIWHRDFSRCFDVLHFLVDQVQDSGSFTEWIGKEDELDW